eukprot:1148859-Pelagomonas_calceolata.AAC.1
MPHLCLACQGVMLGQRIAKVGGPHARQCIHVAVLPASELAVHHGEVAELAVLGKQEQERVRDRRARSTEQARARESVSGCESECKPAADQGEVVQFHPGAEPHQRKRVTGLQELQGVASEGCTNELRLAQAKYKPARFPQCMGARARAGIATCSGCELSGRGGGMEDPVGADRGMDKRLR